MTDTNPGSPQDMYDEWHYAPSVAHNGLAFFSGVTGMRPDGTYSDDPRTQFTDLFERLADNLAAAGLSFIDVIDTTTYHCDMSTFPIFREVRDQYVTAPWPAWTAVGVTELVTPDAQAEVKIICRAGQALR